LLGPEWYSTFYYADDDTEAYLSLWRASLLTAYPQADAADFWRTACPPFAQCTGTRIAQNLRRAYGHRYPSPGFPLPGDNPLPEEIDDAHYTLDALLADALSGEDAA